MYLLEKKSAELSDMSAEVQRLTRCLSVLEDEKRIWQSVEGNMKVTVSALREELLTSERKHEEEMSRRTADFDAEMKKMVASLDAEKCSLEQQLSSVHDELRGKVVDYESQLTSLKLEKNRLETTLAEVST